MEQDIISALELIRSSEPDVIDSGLKQIDAILTRICTLDTNLLNTRSTVNRKFRIAQLFHKHEVKEFLRLQDSYTFNIVSRISSSLNRLHQLQNSQCLIQALETIQGICLLHYPSRQVFSNNHSMTILLNILCESSDPKVQIAGITTLVSIMVREVSNIRKFESSNGLEKLCTVFKDVKTSKQVKMQLIEFWFFYLIPETRRKSITATTIPGIVERKTSEEKQKLLSQYLSNVSGLVREFNTSKPFGEMDLEW